MPTKTKFCGTCQREHPVEEFAKNRSRPDGLATQCRAAKKAMQDDWYQRNKAEHILKVGINSRRVREEHGNRVVDYLRTHPCVDCGEKDPVVLEFDHVRGKKTMAVSQLVCRGYGWDKIQREINKCDVRCANCHRRATARRGNWTSWQICGSGA